MENMTHFVEEGDNIIMCHKGGSFGSRLRQIRHHRRNGVVALPIREIIASNEGPDSGMRIFCLYMAEN
jgi:hypothetical protein